VVERHEPLEVNGVLRGSSTAQVAKCATCFAQNDKFVEGLRRTGGVEKNWRVEDNGSVAS
jgi:hypothetical protein